MSDRNDLEVAICKSIAEGSQWVSSLVLEGKFNLAESGMSVLKKLEDALKELQGISHGEATMANGVGAPKERDRIITSSDPLNEELPYFFFNSTHLVKIGPAQSKDGGAAYYRKIVQRDEVIKLVRVLASFYRSMIDNDVAKRQFGANDFLSFLKEGAFDSELKEKPSYHTNILLGALCKAGVLSSGKRAGRFVFAVDTPDSDVWVKAIEGLKERSDLLAIAKS